MIEEIIISENSGYCMGVKKAFEKTIALTDKYDSICIYGEMVHNRFALNSLKKYNIIKEDNLDSIISNNVVKTVIIRAHGVPPSVELQLKNAGKTVFDFTCPKVKKVQLLAGKLSKDGYFVIIFGKPTHPEVVGILGYCSNNSMVVTSMDNIDFTILNNHKKVALISQTTMNSIKFNDLSLLLKTQVNGIQIFDTLCRSPIKMQESALSLAKKTDLMIVVGDRMSANTTTLYEKIKSVTEAVFIEDVNELDIEKVISYKKIGISGGSSTPPEQINEVVAYLRLKNN